MVAGLQLESAESGAKVVDASKYLSIIGSLSYLAVGTRPDLAFTVNYLARFLACPQAGHWTALKHLLRYLSSTREDGIWFRYGDVNGKLDVYCDANWGGRRFKMNAWAYHILIRLPNRMGVETTVMRGNIDVPR